MEDKLNDKCDNHQQYLFITANEEAYLILNNFHNIVQTYFSLRVIRPNFVDRK